MERNEKTYIVNGKLTNEYGEEIKTNAKNGAKKASKAVSIIFSLGMAAILVTGAVVPASIIISEAKAQKQELGIVATVTPKEDKEYNILLCDGTVIKADKDYVSAAIYNQDNICVDGVYYSDTEEQLVHIEASYTTKSEIEIIKVKVYEAPAGYIAIGKRCYKAEGVIEATRQKDDKGNVTYTVPSGYILIGTKGVTLEAYKESIDAIEKNMISAPTGYIIEDGKAVKYETRKITYILTLEEYANNLEEILSINGEVDNYSGKTVTTKPLSALYETIGIEQPKADKLTK